MNTLLKAPPITTEQFLAFQAPLGFRDELIEGEIVLSPDPKPFHHDVAEQVYLLLRNCLPQDLYKVGSRVNIKLDRDHSMPSPDVFVLPHAEWMEARRKNTYPTTSPILAVEVISPANRKKRILQKVEIYLKNGSKTVWLVYPKARKVEVYSSGQSNPDIYGEGGTLSLPHPLPRISVAIREIFAGPDCPK